MKRLVIALIILLFLFLFAAKRGASGKGVVVTTSPPEGAVLLLNLPNVYILPNSPFYFLAEAWRELRLFLAATPAQRTTVFFSLAEAKMVEVVKMVDSQRTEDGKTGGPASDPALITLIDNYQNYLSAGYRVFGLVQNPKKREELYFEKQKETKNFELFKSFLAKVGVEVNWRVPL